MPKPLDTNRLKQFESRSAAKSDAAAGTEGTMPLPDRWPSREPVTEGQISIKGSLDIIERFKNICKEDRRTYADMLGILIDQHEAKK